MKYIAFDLALDSELTNKVQTIKLFRAALEIGLKEAKEFVEGVQRVQAAPIRVTAEQYGLLMMELQSGRQGIEHWEINIMNARDFVPEDHGIYSFI